ncbi:MAG TPA: heme-binding protein [Solirubrobacteraceae bacterium]|nr:heme-binding protein [Solirubrobacteraceae bacterium]
MTMSATSMISSTGSSPALAWSRTASGLDAWYVGASLRPDGTTIAERFVLDERESAAHGGTFPVIVRDVGAMGTVAVSGLPQEDDHRLVIETVRAFLAETAA